MPQPTAGTCGTRDDGCGPVSLLSADASAASPIASACLADERRLGDLIAAARRNEPGALGELLAAARGYLVRIADGRIPTEVRAHLAPSDVVQNTTVAAHAALTSFQGTTVAEFYGWLRAILANDVFDALRRQRSYDRAVVLGPGSAAARAPERSPTAPTRPTEASAIRRDDAMVVARVLDTLGAETREVMRLRYWEDLPFAEIAVRLGRSDNAVRKLWYRAVKRLQLALSAGDG